MTHHTGPNKGNITLLIVLAVASLAVAAVVWFALTPASENTNVASNTGNANANTPANVNTSANANIAANANANTNTNNIPAGWETYDSRASEFSHINRLDPSFTVSYPAVWEVHEDLGGVSLAEAGIGDLEPQIGISRSEERMTGDMVEACKERARNLGPRDLIFDVTKTIKVSDVDSAYVSYHVPETVQTHPSSKDGVLVCIPLANATDTFWGRPRSSDVVQSYLDAILSTYRLHNSTGEGG